jgi:ActR/RegA family two-component response regulator
MKNRSDLLFEDAARALYRADTIQKDELIFSAPLSVSRANFENIHERLIKMVAEISTNVRTSTVDDVACLNVGLFWIKKIGF